MNTVSWQRCPLCNGEGVIVNTQNTTAKYIPCTVCYGAKIISCLTGKPPAEHILDLTPKNNPFTI